MAFSQTRFLKQLDGPESGDRVPDARFQEEAIRFLSSAFQAGRLNENQCVNALHNLFKIASDSNHFRPQILQMFVVFSGHEDLRVRSLAVRLAIGLASLSSPLMSKMEFSNEQSSKLVSAVKCGITDFAANYLRAKHKTDFPKIINSIP